MDLDRFSVATFNLYNLQLPDRAMNPRKVRTVMRRRLKYTTPTQAIDDAIRLLKGTTP